MRAGVADTHRHLHFAARQLLSFADLDVETGVLEDGACHIDLSPSTAPGVPPGKTA